MLVWAHGLFDIPADTVALSPPSRAWALGSLPQALSCHVGYLMALLSNLVSFSSLSPLPA